MQGPPVDKWEATTADTHQASKTFGLASRHLAAMLSRPSPAVAEVHARLQALYPEYNITHMPTDAIQGRPPAQPEARDAAILAPAANLSLKSEPAVPQCKEHAAGCDVQCLQQPSRLAAFCPPGQPDTEDPIALSARAPKRRRMQCPAPADAAALGPELRVGDAAGLSASQRATSSAGAEPSPAAAGSQENHSSGALSKSSASPGLKPTAPSATGCQQEAAPQCGMTQPSAALLVGQEGTGQPSAAADCCPLLANAAVAGDSYSWHVDAGEHLLACSVDLACRAPCLHGQSPACMAHVIGWPCACKSVSCS